MMATRKRLATWVAVLLAVVLLAGAAFLVRQIFFGPKTITAYFPTATAIYPGDEVRVSGIEVGTIESIEPEGTQTKLVLKVDRDVSGACRCQSRDRRAEPDRGALCAAHAGIPAGRRTEDG